MSETPTLTLADFLLARIDEDEANAKALSIAVEVGPLTTPLAALGSLSAGIRKVRAECDAKRRIVEWYSEEPGRAGPAVAMLAEVYADHPEFREEWRV